MRGVMDDLTTEHSFDLQATWAIGVLGIFVANVIHWCLYNQAMTDVRSTGAGVNCQNCIREEKGISSLIRVSVSSRYDLSC